MSITGVKAAGARLVVFELDPRTALDVWFHLHASLTSEATTRASRIHVAGVLPSLERALVATGVISAALAASLARQMARTPAPPPIDDAISHLQRST